VKMRHQAASLLLCGMAFTSVAEVLVTSGNLHSCAWERDGCGDAMCWGRNDHGQAEAPPGPFKTVSAGQWHTCGLLSNTGLAACWGLNDENQSSPPETIAFQDLSCGFAHCCGLMADSTVHCWGSDSHDQVSSRPVDKFVAISAGAYHTCGILHTGGVACWGGASFGVTSPPTGSFSSITSGFYFSCATDVHTQDVACWGRLKVPSVLAGPFASFSAGYTHVCGLQSSGDVQCWGSDGAGAMEVPDVHDFMTLGTASALHACATSRTQGLMCWGRDNVGESAVMAPLWMCQDENRTEIPDTLAVECQDDRQVCLLAPGGTYTVVGSEDRPECTKTATFEDYTFMINKTVCGVTTIESEGASQVDTVRLEVTPPSGRERALASTDVEAEVHNVMQCNCVHSELPPTDSPSSTTLEDTANLAASAVHLSEKVLFVALLLAASGCIHYD